MQRDASFEVPLTSTHVGAAKTTGCLDADALGSGLERRCHGALHGTTERNAAFELVGNAACKQRGVKLGVVDLDDVELDSASGNLLKTGAHALRLGSATTDDNTRATRVDIDLDLLVTDTLDIDA